MNNKIPPFLIEMLETQYEEEIVKTIIKGYEANRLTTFRVNTLKATNEEIKNRLIQENIDYEGVSWNKDALIIKNANEKEIQKLDIYEEGKIYLQSLSSMIPPIILSPNPKQSILDMTAAPRKQDNTNCSNNKKPSRNYSL